MKIVYWIDLSLLVLLAISTALVKLFQMPEEMALFEAMGFSTGATVAFGGVQLLAGLALLSKKTRKIGAGVLIPTFLIATAALFVSSVQPFGVLSLLFIAMAALPIAYTPES